MHAVLDDLTSFEIVDRTGRDITSDVHHSGFDGQAIAAAAGHAARIGNADPEALTEWLNRDYHDMVVPGMPSDMHPGQTRKYVVGDLERLAKTPRFKALLKQARKAEQDHRDLLAAQKREAAADAKRVAAEIEREKQASPYLWAMVDELRAEVAALRGDEFDGRNLRSPLLRD